MGLPACGDGHAAAAPEGGRLRARCRVQTGRQWPSPGRPQAARESGARSNCCTRRGHDDCATATGWPGGRRPIAPLAVPLARPYRAVRPCRSAGTLSVRVTPNRCSLAPRAPMHACMPGCARVADAERAARRTNGPAASAGAGVLPGRLGIAMAEVGGPCPLSIGTHCGRPASQLPRTAGRCEARGACGGRLRGAAHPLRQLAAATKIGAHSTTPYPRPSVSKGAAAHTPHPIDIRHSATRGLEFV